MIKPHDVDPSLLKPKKQKTEIESQNANTATAPTATAATTSTISGSLNSRHELNKTPQNLTKKRQTSNSPATVTTQTTEVVSLAVPIKVRN